MITLDLVRIICFLVGGISGLVVGFVVAVAALTLLLKSGGLKIVKAG